MLIKKYSLLFGMYFLPDLKVRLLVEVDMRSVLLPEAATMDCDMRPPAGGLVRAGAELRSPVIDWDMLGGSSPTPAMLELPPANINTLVKCQNSTNISGVEICHPSLTKY